MNIITAKAVLGELLEAYDECEHGDYFYDNGDEVCDAVDCILGEPRWISVEERLPDKKGMYLVHTSGVYVKSFMRTAYWTPCYDGFESDLEGKSVWYIYDSEYGDVEIDNVTHWMPLPDAPEVEG